MKLYLGTWTGTDAHVAIVERALGKLLPAGVEIHHVDGNGRNNAHSNLVVCPDKAYHKLLHIRTQALSAYGDPSARKCNICKEWDSPSNLYIYHRGRRSEVHHRSCKAQYDATLAKRNPS